jgi:hypothetical protein
MLLIRQLQRCLAAFNSFHEVQAEGHPAGTAEGAVIGNLIVCISCSLLDARSYSRGENQARLMRRLQKLLSNGGFDGGMVHKQAYNVTCHRGVT